MSTKLQQMAEAADSPHAAQRASFLSLKYMKEKNKAAWVALFAEEGLLQDPVGPSPLDPSGQGFRGKEGIGRFWDLLNSGVTSASFTVEVIESFPCGDECANDWFGVHTQPDGTVFKAPVISVYRVNAAGKLLSVKGYWDTSALK